MKKLSIALILAIFWSLSAACAYIYGSSNLLGGYPRFDKYLPYNPSRSDMEQYIYDAKSYINACDNDIQEIYMAQQDAVNELNIKIEQFRSDYKRFYP